MPATLPAFPDDSGDGSVSSGVQNGELGSFEALRMELSVELSE